MHRAVRPYAGVPELVRAKACGARVDAVDEKGRTALLMASAAGAEEIVSWLLDAGADPLLRSEAGWCALHAAAAAGHVRVCEQLLDAVSPGDAARMQGFADCNNHTAADLAHAARHVAVLVMLLSRTRSRAPL